MLGRWAVKGVGVSRSHRATRRPFILLAGYSNAAGKAGGSMDATHLVVVVVSILATLPRHIAASFRHKPKKNWTLKKTPPLIFRPPPLA